MAWPFVSRERLDEAKERIAALEKELHRFHDLIFKNTFGVQIHDTLPVETAQATAPEPEDPPMSERDREIAELKAIYRTRPSQLGPALERFMSRDVMQRAQAARAPMTVGPAAKIFQNAKDEALKR